METPDIDLRELPSIDLALYEARRERANANYRLQQAYSRTDPTVYAGPRVFGSGDVAVVAWFSLPLHNHALNPANIDRATAEQRQTDAEVRMEHIQDPPAFALVA